MLLLKNPQFFPNHYENWSKCGTNENLILTKIHKDWVKIVDLLIKANFFMCTFFCIRPYVLVKVTYRIVPKTTPRFMKFTLK